MGFLAGDFTPHPNSLMFNGIPIFWPFKAFWFFRKVSLIKLNLFLSVWRDRFDLGLPNAC
jgi:hypothetical protein